MILSWKYVVTKKFDGLIVYMEHFKEDEEQKAMDRFNQEVVPAKTTLTIERRVDGVLELLDQRSEEVTGKPTQA